eukprot:365296-Chlamydomonas_euryale.AAC.21
MSCIPPEGSVLSGGCADSVGDDAVLGVVTVSDRASTGVYNDLSGPAILNFFDDAIESPWKALYRLVPDEQQQIADAIVELVDVHGCCLVVTTGGTGPAPRDVTPEATESVCSRMMPGHVHGRVLDVAFVGRRTPVHIRQINCLPLRWVCSYGEQMRAISLRYVPTAVLSRQTAGIRGSALVINLPGAKHELGADRLNFEILVHRLAGKPKSIRETFDEVFQSIPYCIQLAGGPYICTRQSVVKAFRPPADRREANVST